MKKNGILTLLFAFIPGAGQMYQGYMKRGLSLVLMAAAISMAAMLIPPIAFALLVVFMYSFFDTFNLRAQISMGTAPEDDYLVHFDPQDKRLARMMMDSHKLVGWCLIAIGALIAYEPVSYTHLALQRVVDVNGGGIGAHCFGAEGVTACQPVAPARGGIQRVSLGRKRLCRLVDSRAAHAQRFGQLLA